MGKGKRKEKKRNIDGDTCERIRLWEEVSKMPRHWST